MGNVAYCSECGKPLMDWYQPVDYATEILWLVCPDWYAQGPDFRKHYILKRDHRKIKPKFDLETGLPKNE